MAISCSANQHLLLHFIIITVLFSLVIPFTSSLSFNYSKFSPTDDDNMTYERAARPENGIIQLVSRFDDVGRATYGKGLPLWDKTTRKLTDFTTHFSFIIDSQNSTSYGDGLAFFLAPEDSKSVTHTGGGSFGLTKANETLNSKSNPFVAVEFDIFYNSDWDPPGNHVGIDNSSLRSSTSVSWLSNVKGGQRNEAWISYNSSTKNLSVAFTGFKNNATAMQYLDCEIDLRLYLPELVTFGFSGATGVQSANFSVHSWEFNSSLEAANRPPPSDNSTNSTPSRRRKSRAGLAVGLSIGGAFLVGGLLLVWLAVLQGGQNLSQSSVSNHNTNSSQLTSSSGASSSAALLNNTH
ncbi:hypothetical protein Patl1_33859 [Pistacia atlantica]|uniref:Uncharacterized protein n=1 Tax=Pistacia atlantica TaxID=434234 RepID=A0ACC0ZTC7_9ROSI|nr:hypothetical protein Patl1_33859 [Pistacia atlantica]